MSETQNLAVIEMRGVSVGAMRDVSFTVVEEVNWSVARGRILGHRRASNIRAKAIF